MSSLTILIIVIMTKNYSTDRMYAPYVDVPASHGCFNSILGWELSCQILWNGNFELETKDSSKFAVLHFEGYSYLLMDSNYY